ncbi:MAG: DUF2332 family protein [Devosia sp.]
MPDTQRVLSQFADQTQACEDLGSPFTAMVCRVLATRLDTRTRFGKRILEWDGDPYPDNVALRACGAMHALARLGQEPRLTAAYPPNAADEASLWSAIAAALPRNDDFLTDFLSSPPQTNEVARSALILGGMLHLGAITRLPFDLLEIGASAGLNQAFDEYAYDLGEGRAWGSPAAPLTIPCRWRGPVPPLEAPIAIAARAGCDLRPIDPANGEDRLRLTSYVWADQTHRIVRLEAALAHAAARGRTVDGADAADWVEQKLAAPRQPGTTRVLFHTIVWDYVSAPVRARIIAARDRAAASATSEAPFAHLTVESDEVRGGAAIRLAVWPGGADRFLGRGDFHGRWAEWA